MAEINWTLSVVENFPVKIISEAVDVLDELE